MTEEANVSGPSLIELVFNAPLVGVRKRWPNVLHAVEMEGLPWPEGKAVSACGITGLRVVADERSMVMPWPPRVASIPDGMSRCRPCHEATGKLRPRSEFRTKVDA